MHNVVKFLQLHWNSVMNVSSDCVDSFHYYNQLELLLLILVCIYMSCFIYFGKNVVQIGHGNSFRLVLESHGKWFCFKEWSPWYDVTAISELCAPQIRGILCFLYSDFTSKMRFIQIHRKIIGVMVVIVNANDLRWHKASPLRPCVWKRKCLWCGTTWESLDHLDIRATLLCCYCFDSPSLQ